MSSITQVFIKMILDIIRNLANFRFGCAHKKGSYMKMNKFTLKDFLFLQIGPKKKNKAKQIAEMDFRETKNNFVFKIVFYIDIKE